MKQDYGKPRDEGKKWGQDKHPGLGVFCNYVQLTPARCRITFLYTLWTAPTSWCVDLLPGKCPKKENAAFWDAVIISAADEQQAAAFRLQIQRKRERGLLPLVPYHVFADLPGAKMGMSLSDYVLEVLSLARSVGYICWSHDVSQIYL